MTVDFSKGERGAVIKRPGTKQRITIRIDEDLLDWFRQQVEDGGSYQTLMNQALRAYVVQQEAHSAPKLEAIFRKVLREEFPGGSFEKRRRQKRMGPTKKKTTKRAAKKAGK